MRVSIFLFAAFREKAGSGRLQIEMAEGATAGDALRRVAQDVPQIARLLGSAALAVNAEYAGPDVRLKDGDEVALIPPVSGGASRVATASITEKSIDADAAIAGLVRPADGALVVFQGVVRAFTDGRRLLHMEYEAYRPMAERLLQRIAEDVRARHGVDHIVVVHRVGRIAVGEASLLIAVASPHRKEAFDACQEMVDRIKDIAPIWKKEVWEGGEAWVACEHGHS